ncbi:MAG: AAA family ATPase [Bacteroidetes bacterium]|nr:AAA family ATPase [Bacteroidota bacterium]
MERKTITEEIKDWIKDDLAYWEQYLASRILNKQKLGENEIKAAYKYFLEDNDLAKKESDRPSIEIQTTVSIGSVAPKFLLKEIKNVEGVNALKEKQVVPISENLTIIYGENGAGKSGYIRLMNNAFVSRGDMNIESNIYSDDDPKETSCIFKFIKGEEEYELKYPEDSDRQEFNSYAVFDTSSITAHLNQEDEIQFLPSGLEFFDLFAKAIERVKTYLNEAYANNTPENSFSIHFDKDTTVKKIVDGLNGYTDIKIVRAKATLSPEETIVLGKAEKKLLELRKTDVGKKVAALKGIKTLLAEIKVCVDEINPFFSETVLLKYKKTLADHALNKELSSKEGLAQFKTDSLENIGNKEWKNLIVAAKEFAQTQYDDEEKYPSKDDICLLCHQPLPKEAKSLIEAYWKYLTSNAERELKALAIKITEGVEALTDLDTKILDEKSRLYEWLSENSEPNLKIWVAQIKGIESLRKKVLSALKVKKWNDEIEAKQITIKPFAVIEKFIDGKIAELNEAEIKRSIKETEKIVAEFNDRKKLGQLFEKIESFVKKHKWALKAQSKVFTTRKISTKQKDLFSTFVTDQYIEIFNKECEKLNANFGIEISQRSHKGNTLKHLMLKGRYPGAILSEGEQRAISIADFLTEIQIGNKNKGIVFDDPVNSLDHKRRQIIAERLINEAKIRQVIIFTHDITFLLALQTLAEEHKTNKLITTIRKIGETPGEIRNDIPWVASNVKQKIGKLTDMLVVLKKIEKNGDDEEYGLEAKSWSGLLREAWERSVEQFLFNDAIQRFSPSIQTQRLKQAKYTPELFAEVERGMTECSKWVHDQAMALNSPPPNTTKLEQYLVEFKTFADKFK